jgi:hypothetical protein
MTVQERENVWAERIASFKTSGQTKKAWCRNNNVDVKSFYRWTSRLNNKLDNDQIGNRFLLAKEISNDDAVRNGNVKNIGITIGNITINVGKGFDTDTLKNVLQIVGGIC